MRGELALLRRAVGGLAAEREKAPDYSETLGTMDGRLSRIAHNIVVLAEHPAMRLTPEAFATQIGKATRDVREGDAETITTARTALENATARADRRETNARTVQAQRRFVMRTIGAVAAATALLCSFVPGIIARSLPERLRVPERMAARVLRLDPWTAGERLLMTADAERWETVLRGNRILQDNRDVLEACERAATKDRKRVRCTVLIGRS